MILMFLMLPFSPANLPPPCPHPQTRSLDPHKKKKENRKQNNNWLLNRKWLFMWDDIGSQVIKIPCIIMLSSFLLNARAEEFTLLYNIIIIFTWIISVNGIAVFSKLLVPDCDVYILYLCTFEFTIIHT